METVEYKGRKIEYELVRKNVKNINLRVHPDQTVSVSASPLVPLQTINDFVYSKAEFILKSIDRFADRQSRYLEHKYLSGETIYIFGKGFILKVVEDKKNYVVFDGVNVFLHVKNSQDFILKQRVIQRWIDSITIKEFEIIFEEVYSVFEKYGIVKPELKTRNMRSKWGSCQYQKGIITLNKQLILYPRECTEYVIMHEFCHLVHPNHSKDFYLFLTMHMPDWKHRKAVLES